jgi:hypothetical protein
MVIFTAYVAIPSRSFFDDATLHPNDREREVGKSHFPIGAVRRHEELLRRQLRPSKSHSYKKLHFLPILMRTAGMPNGTFAG